MTGPIPGTVNGPGQPATWRCICGHPLYDHAPDREPDAAGRPYRWTQCRHCGCERFVSEYDAQQLELK